MRQILSSLIVSITIVMYFFNTPAFAEWIKIGKTNSGDTFYVDWSNIRYHEGYEYFWVLRDFASPQLFGSSDTYFGKGDCKNFRYKYLTTLHFEKPIGEGAPILIESFTDVNRIWEYPSPETIYGKILKLACN